MFERSLGTLLRAVIARLDGDVQAVYDDRGTPFRPRFYLVVQELLEHGACTVGQLADAAGVSQPAITQTVAEMAKLGLVRSARGKDARQRRITLSESGRRIVEELQPLWTATHAAAADLDRELPHSLSSVLQATLEALDRRPFRERIRRKLNE